MRIAMTTCCEISTCTCAPAATKDFERVSARNTLAFDAAACIHCGMCSAVCPHAVFVMEKRRMRIARADDCMECGACALNCPVGALQVDSGVGCAAAMIYTALTGRTDHACSESPSSCC